MTCRRAMALNAAESVRKGQPVVVTGWLRERFWTSNGRSGQSLEVEAETLGHDLSFGTTQFVRIVRAQRVETGKDREAAEMAYLLANDAARGAAGRQPVDVSGLTVLDDVDAVDGLEEGEPGYPGEHDPEPEELDGYVALLPDPAVA